MTETLKRMSEPTADLPEGFKMTELGPLPKEWQVTPLGEVVSFSRRKKIEINPDQLIPFIPMALLPEDGLYIKRWEMRHPSEIRSGVFFQKGDFLLAKITPCFENGKQGIVQNFPVHWGIATTEVFPIRTGDNLYCEFLAMYLKLPSVRASLEEKMQGTTGRKRLSKEVIQALLFPIPPLHEQQAITHVLQTVQRAKEATERVIQAARELKKSLMRHLFTYGPVPVEEAERVPLKETEIGLVPEHWVVVRLGELVEGSKIWIKNGFAQGSYNQSGDGVPHLRPFNISVDGDIILNQVKYVPTPSKDSPYWLKPGDIIFNNTNSEELVGKTAYFSLDGDYVLSNHMTIIRVLDFESLDPYWLAKKMHHIWELGFFRSICRRHVNQASISLERLKQTVVSLPPLSEQQEIARILIALDKKIQAEEARKQALDALFKTLLHYLMTGKIRVNPSLLKTEENDNGSLVGTSGSPR